MSNPLETTDEELLAMYDMLDDKRKAFVNRYAKEMGMTRLEVLYAAYGEGLTSVILRPESKDGEA